MGEDKDDPARLTERNMLARHLAKGTGVTEEQARSLISMLGADRNSLVREARIIFRESHRLA